MAIRIPKWLGHAALGLSVMIPAMSHAVSFNISGFGTVTAGKVTDSENFPNLDPAKPKFGSYDLMGVYSAATGAACPCYAASVISGGVYDKNLSVGQESRLGLQGEVEFTDQLSFTTQAVARKFMGSPTVRFEWAYLSYKPTDKLTLQLGRKRVPLFYYSDFQDVSFALPWARVPNDAYFWPVNNYNGVSGSYQSELPFDISLKTNAYYGNEREKQPASVMLSSGNTNPEPVVFQDMKGLSFEFTRDWLSYKYSFNQNTKNTNGKLAKQGFYSWALNVDYKDFVLRSESARYYSAAGPQVMKIIGVGYTVKEKFLPMITFTERKTYDKDAKRTLLADFGTKIYSLRYNIGATSSLKLQYEQKLQRFYFGGKVDAAGRQGLTTVTYDFVF